jgi:hypothetical protein
MDKLLDCLAKQVLKYFDKEKKKTLSKSNVLMPLKCFWSINISNDLAFSIWGYEQKVYGKMKRLRSNFQVAFSLRKLSPLPLEQERDLENLTQLFFLS